MSSQITELKRLRKLLRKLETLQKEQEYLSSVLPKLGTPPAVGAYLRAATLTGPMSVYRDNVMSWLESELRKTKKQEDIEPSLSRRTSSGVGTTTSRANSSLSSRKSSNMEHDKHCENLHPKAHMECRCAKRREERHSRKNCPYKVRCMYCNSDNCESV